MCIICFVFISIYYRSRGGGCLYMYFNISSEAGTYSEGNKGGYIIVPPPLHLSPLPSPFPSTLSDMHHRKTYMHINFQKNWVSIHISQNRVHINLFAKNSKLHKFVTCN